MITKSGTGRRKFLALLATAGMGTGILGATFGATEVRAQQVSEFWHYLGAGGELEGVEAMMAIADKKLGGKVKHRVVPGGVAGVRQQVQVSLMGGVPPVSYQVSAGVELNLLAQSGRLVALDKAWTQIKGDQVFPKGLIQVVSFGGNHYGIPFSMSLLGNAWYNKAVFDRLGLKPPTNWAEWDEVAQTLSANGVIPVTSAAGPAWTTYQFYGPFLEAFGTEGFWEFVQGKVPLTDPRLVKAFDLFEAHFVKYFDKNWTGAKWSDGLDRLMKGEVGMYVMGDWASGYMKQRGWTPGKEYDFFPSPGLGGYAIFQSDVAVVLKGKLADVGEEFAAALADPVALGAFAKAKGSLSPHLQTDPSVYDAIGKKEFDLTMAKDTTVLPNLYTLLPPGLKEDFGSAIEKFAATKDRAALNKELERLETMRTQKLAAGEFSKF